MVKDTTFKNNYRLIDNIGSVLLVLTDANAPKWQLVMIDPAKPHMENWKKIIPETNDLLESVSLCNGKIVAKYLHDVTSKLFIYDMNGKMEKELSLLLGGRKVDLVTEKFLNRRIRNRVLADAEIQYAER